MTEAAASRAPALRAWIRRLAAPVVVVAVVVAIVRQAGLGRIRDALAEGHLAPLLPIALVAILAALLLVTTWDRMIIGAALGPVSFTAIARARAATAVLQLLGYAYAGGGYGVWLARATGCGAGAAAAVVLYGVASDFAALSVFGVAAALAVHADLPAFAWAALLVGIAVIPAIALATRSARAAGRSGLVVAWRRIPLRRGLLQAGGRCVNIAVLTIATWVAARAFGIALPFSSAMAYLPLVMLASALPIANVAGFGAGQAASILFLRPWATDAQLVAFQFVWQTSLGLAVVARGLPFLRRVIREIDEGKAAAGRAARSDDALEAAWGRRGRAARSDDALDAA